MSELRLALVGGTFDPFHRGHVEPLRSVWHEMRWSRAVYIPAFRQPFKQGVVISSGFHRYAMAVLATLDDERLRVESMELERSEISYTVDTLEVLRGRYPGAVLDWVIGDDNLAMLGQWKAIDRLFELGNFVVLARTESPEVPPELGPRVLSAEARTTHGALVLARNDAMPISATTIRGMVREEKSIDGMVEPVVARYINRYGLYCSEMEPS